MEVDFIRKDKLVCLGRNTWTPFNSQATLFHKSVFPILYLPCHVSFRMTDIWRSFIAQSFLKSNGQNIAFTDPCVYQDRNPHDLTKDMKKEYLGYENNVNLINELMQDSESIYSYLPGKSIRAFGK